MDVYLQVNACRSSFHCSCSASRRAVMFGFCPLRGRRSRPSQIEQYFLRPDCRRHTEHFRLPNCSAPALTAAKDTTPLWPCRDFGTTTTDVLASPAGGTCQSCPLRRRGANGVFRPSTTVRSPLVSGGSRPNRSWDEIWQPAHNVGILSVEDAPQFAQRLPHHERYGVPQFIATVKNTLPMRVIAGCESENESLLVVPSYPRSRKTRGAGGMALSE